MKRLALIGWLAITPLAMAENAPEAIADNCRICHNSASQPTLPALDRLSKAALQQQLLDYKYDRLTATIMPRLAKGFSDAELAAVAQLLGK